MQESQEPTEEQLQQLAVLAEQLKLAGNKALQSGESDEALKVYTQGIEAATAAGALARKTLSLLFSNRAAVKMSRNLFVDVVDDCRRAVSSDVSNVKAYWRAAKASMSLDLYQQAVDFCKSGLLQDPTHQDLTNLLTAASKSLQAHQEKREQANRGFTEEEAIHAQEVAKEYGEQFSLISQKVMACEYEDMKNSRTVALLSDMPDSTPCYKTIGRGFVLDNKPSIVSELSARSTEITSTELPELLEAKKQIQERKSQADSELTEIIKYFQSKKKVA
jgi:tetratricopeptide (TPR) repeat protein